MGRNVARVSYATSLQKKGVLISTTEHLLSAFIGIGLDNAIVELDNLELPILDGSAKPFVDLVLQAGLKQQRKLRSYLRILRETEVREGNKSIVAYPASGYSVAYNINFARPIGEQSFEIDLSRDLYRKDVLAAFAAQFEVLATAARLVVLVIDEVTAGAALRRDHPSEWMRVDPATLRNQGSTLFSFSRHGFPSCVTKSLYQ